MHALNRWSAEVLMGWRQMTFSKLLAQFNQLPFTNHYCDSLVWVTKDNQLSIPIGKTWNPLDRNTGQIWMCVEKMRELGFNLGEASSSDEEWDDDIYRPYFYHRKTKKYYVAEGKDFRTAILTAAKAALERGVEG